MAEEMMLDPIRRKHIPATEYFPESHESRVKYWREHVPSDEEMREHVTYGDWGDLDFPGEWFDNWLKKHDAEVAGKAWSEGELAGARNQRDFALYQGAEITEAEYVSRERSNPYAK